MKRIKWLMASLIPILMFSSIFLSAQEGEMLDTLKESHVSAIRQINSTQLGFTRLDASKINCGFAFFSTPDVIKTVQALPGVSSGSELMSGLFVHGGDGSDNLYRLNGVPLYSISHLIGFFSAFNSDIVESVDFYRSGFPARFGGRMSSVLDVYTRDGSMNSTHGTFSIGLIDGRAQIEGPIIRNILSYNLSLRRTWADAFMPLAGNIMSDEFNRCKFGYYFYDLNARIKWAINKRNILRLNIFNGKDSFNYFEEQYQRDKFGESHLTNHVGYDSAWGNTILSVELDSKLSDALNANMRIYMTKNNSHFLTDDIFNEYVLQEDILTNSIHQEISEQTRGLVRDFGAAADFIQKSWGNSIIRFGCEGIFHHYEPESYSLMADGTERISNGCVSGGELSGYAEDEFSIGKRLKLNLGTRVSIYSFSNDIKSYFEPRVAFRYFANDNLSMKASYSQMTQYAHQIATTYIDIPMNFWMPSTNRFLPMQSKQIAIGSEGALPHSLRFSSEIWYKTMSNLLEYIGIYTMFPEVGNCENDFAVGEGRSYGAEVELGWTGGKTEVEMNYTLSWTERYFPGIWDNWFYDRNDNRHKFNIHATQHISSKFELFAAWNFHSGNRLTLPLHSTKVEDPILHDVYIQHYSKPNSIQMPAYHRLDIGMNFRNKTKKGHESIWNISIYNAYCRLNPIQVQVFEKDGKPCARAFGLVPIVPTFSYTFKF